jgi:hypothetical protein
MSAGNETAVWPVTGGGWSTGPLVQKFERQFDQARQVISSVGLQSEHRYFSSEANIGRPERVSLIQIKPGILVKLGLNNFRRPENNPTNVKPALGLAGLPGNTKFRNDRAVPEYSGLSL